MNTREARLLIADIKSKYMQNIYTASDAITQLQTIDLNNLQEEFGIPVESIELGLNNTIDWIQSRQTV